MYFWRGSSVAACGMGAAAQDVHDRCPHLSQSRYGAAPERTPRGSARRGRIALARQSAAYIDKILKGAQPVAFPTKFLLIINVTTAKMLGINISPTLLARADEVIE